MACSLSNLLLGQAKFTISGYVTEKGSHENLPGVSVYQAGTRFATTTNAYGFFSITLPKCDTATLVFGFVGYTSQSKQIKLDKNLSINMELPAANELDEVEVVAKKNEPISQDVQMSKIDIPVEKIKEIPALLGEKDVLKVLQLMPGVQKGSEGSSGFYVRGGGPDQNLIILDDATVYNAFHLFGFFSLFNGDALKSIELTKGGFPARYGGRLSSVLDMQMKDGNKEKLHGEAGIGIISSRLVLEGPIIKNKCSFLVSGRRTYIDALVYPFEPAKTKGGYYFYDLNAKVNYILSDKDKLYLSGYFGKDKFYADIKDESYRNQTALGWGNATATLRWNHLFSNKLFANTSLIFTDYKLLISDLQAIGTSTYSLRYSSGIRDYTAKIAFDFLPNPSHFIRYGVNSIYHRFTPGAVVFKGNDIGDFSSTKLIESLESAVFIEDDWKMTAKWRANFGFRLSHFNVRGENYLNPEPRVSFRYLIKSDLSVKGSFAVMNQYVHLLSNTGIGLPTDLWVPATKGAHYMTSIQGAAGISKDFLKKGYDVSLEGYYKKMNHVLGYKEGANFLSIGGSNGDNVSWEKNVTSGQGWSYGTEVLIRKNAGNFTGWIGYTLSWTQLQFDELNFGKKFYARYDRRHDISVVGIYKINKHITVSATWVYGTGNAITLPLNTYVTNMYSPSGTGSLTIPFNQAAVFDVQDYGQQRNAYRMSPYHRADIGIQFNKKFPKFTRTFELSFYNLYNRKNPFFYFIQTNQDGVAELKQLSLFPIIPSVSWTVKF